MNCREQYGEPFPDAMIAGLGHFVQKALQVIEIVPGRTQNAGRRNLLFRPKAQLHGVGLGDDTYVVHRCMANLPNKVHRLEL